MDKTVDRLVEFAHGFRYEKLDARATAAIKVRIVDTIACAIGAFTAPPVAIARRLTPVVHEGPRARVFGSLISTTPDFAAFVNGCMARYLDYNDSFHSLGGGHPSDNLPALVGVAEAFELDGRALVAGIAVAYEVHKGFGDTIDFAPLGWDQATSGVIAAALGAGNMLGLSREQLRNAIALAIVPNLPLLQTRVGELSMWKNCCTALGARSGIFAALLAREGMTGPVDPLEGKSGLWKTIGADGTAFVDLEAPERPAAVTQTFLKRWAVADSCQVPVDAACDLYTKLDGRSIASVAVRTYKKSSLDTAVRDRERWEPKTRESADHSMPVVIAMALCDGGVFPERLLLARHERFQDADVRALVRNMTIDFDPEFNKVAPAIRSCSIEARLNDGSTVRSLRQQPSDDLFRMSESELRAKFDQLTRDAMLPADRERFLELVDRIEDVPVRTLVDCLSI